MKTIDDITVYEKLPPYFGPKDWVSIDIEMFGGVKGKLHRPIGEFASIAVTGDGCNVYVITDINLLPQVIERCENSYLVLQNASFDIRHIRRWAYFPVTHKLHDTMLFDRILWGGYYDSFNLVSLVRRYLNCYMDKEARDLFENAKEMTYEMIRYNAIDAAAQWRIAQEQIKITKLSHMQVWRDIDLPALWAFLDAKGALINVDRWREVSEENKRIADEHYAWFEAELGINPRSTQQVKEYLNGKLKLKVDNTGKATLERFRKKHSIVNRLLEYREVEKRRSTYGLNWLKKYVEKDHRVYTNYDINRAESGRTASSDPNLQNVPIREVTVYRDCFIAAPGNILVGGDYGQQEIRAAAYLSGDDILIALLQSGEDIYCQIGSQVYGKIVEKHDPERQDAKAVVLGAIYGLTEYGLARKLSKTVAESRDILDKFFIRFPKLHRWTIQQQEFKPFVTTAYGRRSYLNFYNSQWKNNALNSPCQGTGADMIKMAGGLLHQRWDIRLEPFPFVLQVHDEILLEVKEENEEYAVNLLRTCMIEAGEKNISGVPVTVDIKSGRTWLEVH